MKPHLPLKLRSALLVALLASHCLWQAARADESMISLDSFSPSSIYEPGHEYVPSGSSVSYDNGSLILIGSAANEDDPPCVTVDNERADYNDAFIQNGCLHMENNGILSASTTVGKWGHLSMSGSAIQGDVLIEEEACFTCEGGASLVQGDFTLSSGSVYEVLCDLWRLEKN